MSKLPQEIAGDIVATMIQNNFITFEMKDKVAGPTSEDYATSVGKAFKIIYKAVKEARSD